LKSYEWLELATRLLVCKRRLYASFLRGPDRRRPLACLDDKVIDGVGTVCVVSASLNSLTE